MRILAAAMVWLFVVVAGPVRAADPSSAQTFIADLGNLTVAILRQPDLTAERSVAQFRDVFRASFDFPTIGRFVLGRYWPAATEDQQQEYLRLFEDMVIETYARRFTEYSGETFAIVGSRPKGERDVMVESQIVRPDGPPLGIVWRVRDRGGRFLIIDVMVEGVSMSVSQRSEFSAFIQSNGGSIEALLEAMRTQIAEARRS